MNFSCPFPGIVSPVIDCSTKHLNYLRKLDENLNQLKEKMVQLNALNTDVNDRVIAAEAQQMKRTNQVDEWLQRVEVKRLQVDKIILEGTQHLEKGCLNGCCPKNCWSSYKLGKKVEKKIIHVEELKRDGFFEIISDNPPLAVIQELPENTHIVGLDSIFDRAWNFLGENSVRIMGLYGMGGVGKTTLLKRINNDICKRGSNFDIVISVVISKEVNMARVQKEIANKLGLSLSNADNIFNVLKTKKFLLLLDDIWQQIDLLSIGVPSPSFKNKSKLVFTTRSELVCGRMEADKSIRVEGLSWEASWALFQEKVGQNTLISDSDIPRLAEIVAKECLGLPLALITVGRSMASKKTRHEWEHAIFVLKNSAAEFPGMGDDILPLLKFSYDSLPNDSVQLCFLFCSLYPEDYSIEISILIDQWIGEGYISGYNNFKEALNTGHDIIGILKGVCLLEDACHDYFTKMHDVIRDLALWIACECGGVKNKYFVKAGMGLIEATPTGKWPTMAEKISLFNNHSYQLEKIPKCPNLTTLLLVPENGELEHIHNDFFLSTPSLRFLNLSYCGIKEVPTSMCELFELEFLDLSETNILSIPNEMRNLTKLKYLSLKDNNFCCKIPRGIIMNLTNVEFLKLEVIESDDPEGRFEIDELLYLKKLKYLEISIFSYSKCVQKLLSYPKLANCTTLLSISRCDDITCLLLSASSSSDMYLGPLKGLECLFIDNCPEIKELGGVYESLERMELDNLPKLIISWDANNLHWGAHFRQLRDLILERCDAMVDLTWLLLILNLQTLSISKCEGLQEILSSSSSNESGGTYSSNEKTTFSNLRVLYLRELPNLQSICSMSALPFPYLKTIEVRRCPKLKRLPLDSNSANNTLDKIVGEVEWWNDLEWRNETIEPHLAKFFIIGSY